MSLFSTFDYTNISVLPPREREQYVRDYWSSIYHLSGNLLLTLSVCVYVSQSVCVSILLSFSFSLPSVWLFVSLSHSFSMFLPACLSLILLSHSSSQYMEEKSSISVSLSFCLLFLPGLSSHSCSKHSAVSCRYI